MNEGVDSDQPRREYQWRSLAGLLVGGDACLLDRGIGRRQLCQNAHLPRQGSVEVSSAKRRNGSGHDLTFGIVGIGTCAEGDARQVPLDAIHEHLAQACGLPQAHKQHASSHRIQGTGVADLSLTGNAAHACTTSWEVQPRGLSTASIPSIDSGAWGDASRGVGKQHLIPDTGLIAL